MRITRAKHVLSEAEGTPSTLSSEGKDKQSCQRSSLSFSDLCGLCTFARDIPSFGGGLAAQVTGRAASIVSKLVEQTTGRQAKRVQKEQASIQNLLASKSMAR
jgi:hypothetical protein